MSVKRVKERRSTLRKVGGTPSEINKSISRNSDGRKKSTRMKKKKKVRHKPTKKNGVKTSNGH